MLWPAMFPNSTYLTVSRMMQSKMGCWSNVPDCDHQPGLITIPPDVGILYNISIIRVHSNNYVTDGVIDGISVEYTNNHVESLGVQSYNFEFHVDPSDPIVAVIYFSEKPDYDNVYNGPNSYHLLGKMSGFTLVTRKGKTAGEFILSVMGIDVEPWTRILLRECHDHFRTSGPIIVIETDY